MTRKLNFYAGPSVLPLEVFEEIQKNMVEYGDSGLSLIETSHRSTTYDEVHMGAISLIRELFEVPENYKVLLLGGGATLQFGMIPMNFLPKDGHCDFVVSGSWSKKAYDDAKKIGSVNVLFDGKSEGYVSLPDAGDIKPSDGSSYVYITSNETIGGVQWKDWPDTGDVPLFCDMSSDIMSHPVPVEKFGLIYAGAQKNLGPAGVTVVIVRDDLLERCADGLPVYLDYRIHAGKDSLYNTPPVFSIWAMKLVLERMKRMGGIEAMAKHNRDKAALVYDVIDGSDGFYRCPVDQRYRSEMNVVFRLSSEDLEKAFVAEATSKGMMGLKGHRSVGGCRASLYNSMTVEGAGELAEFMKAFMKEKR
ncbi:phosphoserine transaminase [Dethiosulfovibrio sp. F2B]|uniref:phosphoserine transaminase n=1 Tax=Dethiosulfovibrio faecalis TaxID=2720018 RepID=UPI001F1D7B84|nr:phosphoserine transaminase [Dethiosulfovibrio faecalis]MCF4151809.1 phosphoserine transaminase [Dethiosulfovibrio faecalis]